MAALVDFGPELGMVEFPEDWSEDQIDSHLKANYDTIRSDLIAARQQENLVEAEKEGGPDYWAKAGEFGLGPAAGSAASAFAQGLAGIANAGLRTAGRAINTVVDTAGGAESVARRAARDVALGTVPDLDRGPLVELANRSDRRVAEAFPELPGTRDTFWGHDVPQGLGNALGMVAVGGGSALAGASARAAALIGSSAGFGMEADDAYKMEIQRQKDEGETPDPVKAELKSTLYASIATAIETKLGMGRIIKRMQGMVGGGTAAETVGNAVSKGLIDWQTGKKILGNSVKDFIAGGLEEGSQQMAEDLIVLGHTDPAAELRSAQAGAVVQALVGLPTSGHSHTAKGDAVQATTRVTSAKAQASGLSQTAATLDAMANASEALVTPDLVAQDVEEFNAAMAEVEKAKLAEESKAHEEQTDTTPTPQTIAETPPETGVRSETSGPQESLGQPVDDTAASVQEKAPVSAIQNAPSTLPSGEVVEPVGDGTGSSDGQTLQTGSGIPPGVRSGVPEPSVRPGSVASVENTVPEVRGEEDLQAQLDEALGQETSNAPLTPPSPVTETTPKTEETVAQVAPEVGVKAQPIGSSVEESTPSPVGGTMSGYRITGGEKWTPERRIEHGDKIRAMLREEAKSLRKTKTIAPNTGTKWEAKNNRAMKASRLREIDAQVEAWSDFLEKAHRDLEKAGSVPTSTKPDKFTAALDRAIEATNPQAGVSDITRAVPLAALNAILKAIRLTWKGVKLTHAVIAKAIADYRASNPNETWTDSDMHDAVREEYEKGYQFPGEDFGTVTSTPGKPVTTKRGKVRDTVQSRPGITPEVRTENEKLSVKAFEEAGVNVHRLEGENLFRPVEGQSQEEAGWRLANVARRLLREGTGEGHRELVSNLINSLRQNFASSEAFSPKLRAELSIIGQSEASERGRLLGMLAIDSKELGEGGLRDIEGALTRARYVMFQGEEVSRAMGVVTQEFQNQFTPEEIHKILRDHAALKELLDKLGLGGEFPGIVQDVASNPDTTPAGVQEATTNSVSKRTGVPRKKSEKVGKAIAKQLQKPIEEARAKALAKAKRALFGGENKEGRKVPKPLWKKIQEYVNAGGLDTSGALEAIALENGMAPPTEAKKARLRFLSDELTRVQQLTPEDIANKVTPEEKERATRTLRVPIMREMSNTWASMVKPLVGPKWYSMSKQIMANRANAMMEYMAANVLFRPGFVVKQAIDLTTQFAFHTPTRAWASAKEQSDDASKVERINPFMQNLVDAYVQQAKALRSALNEANETLKGRTNRRSGIGFVAGTGFLDRLVQKSEDYSKDGKPIQAWLLWAAALPRLSFLAASAGDHLTGGLVEAQERREYIQTKLMEQGVDRDVARAQSKDIMGDMDHEYNLAKATVSNIADIPESFREGAAWEVVKARQDARMKAAKIDPDNFAEMNNALRDVTGWNYTELHGPGALAAAFPRAVTKWSTEHGFPFALGLFANAIAIATNRATIYAGGGFFPGMYGSKTDVNERSPLFATDKDITQRKVESVLGLSISMGLIGLWLSGALKAYIRWPDDKEEREAWERDGHRPGTIEIQTGDGGHLKISLSTGPISYARPAAAMFAEIDRATERKAKQNAKNAAIAKKKGLKFEPEKLDWSDVAGVGLWAALSTLFQGRTAGGLIGSMQEYNQFSLRKTAATAIKPMVPFLPLAAESMTLSGANIDPKRADFTDLLLPTAWSENQKLNFFSEPVATQRDTDRIISMLTGGTSWGADDEGRAYRILRNTGWRPTSVNPTTFYSIKGSYRQLTPEEFKKMSRVRGKALKDGVSKVDTSMDPIPQLNEAQRSATEAGKIAVGAQ